MMHVSSVRSVVIPPRLGSTHISKIFLNIVLFLNFYTNASLGIRERNYLNLKYLISKH